MGNPATELRRAALRQTCHESRMRNSRPWKGKNNFANPAKLFRALRWRFCRGGLGGDKLIFAGAGPGIAPRMAGHALQQLLYNSTT
jgi:hypothetical protein